MIYGVDVSAYQPNFDFAAARREGFDFAFIKSTEGTNWRSPNYGHQIRDARANGLLVAAYHYVRGSDVAGQLATIRSVVSTDVPVILDVEEGAGSIQSIRDLNAALNRAGYRTPFVYVPQWYHRDHMGSPDLRGLPPNWRSWYPDNTVRRKEAAVAAVPNRIWDELVGGIPTVVMQMTSSMAVANYPNGKIDGNAFRGTREQLAALLGGTTTTEEDDVTPEDRQMLANLQFGEAGKHPMGRVGQAIADTNENVKAVKATVADLAAKVENISITGGTVDYAKLADMVADRLAARLQS